MHALTYVSYKYERWGGFLLYGNKQFAVGCGLDALLAGPMCGGGTSGDAPRRPKAASNPRPDIAWEHENSQSPMIYLH